MTHGCSPFETTDKGLTALDIVTAHSTMPGRDDVALLMEESMRGDGWTGGRVEAKRRAQEIVRKRRGKRREIRKDVGKVLEVDPKWWGPEHDDLSTDSDSEDDEDVADNLFVCIASSSMFEFALTTIADSAS